MKQTIAELNQIVESFVKKISSFSEADFASKPLPHKWSKKEVLGHLIDSGQNNLRRFIVGQYESTPSKIRYEQDFWVNANNYQKMAKADVIALWRLVNLQIASTLESMPPANYSKNCDTGKDAQQLHSLQWLAEDYVKHMKHHLNQIIPGSFDVIYT